MWLCVLLCQKCLPYPFGTSNNCVYQHTISPCNLQSLIMSCYNSQRCSYSSKITLVEIRWRIMSIYFRTYIFMQIFWLAVHFNFGAVHFNSCVTRCGAVYISNLTNNKSFWSSSTLSFTAAIFSSLRALFIECLLMISRHIS